MSKLKDPVEEKKDNLPEIKADETELDIGNFSFNDLKPIPEHAARRRNPFDGYPEKKIKIGKSTVNLTHLVVLKPSEHVFQDPSSVNMVNRKGERYTVKTSHNRMVFSYQDNSNQDIVFDRNLELPNGEKLDRCAFVPDASVRAQICFYIDSRTGKTKVDTRYLLADVGQVSRLREVFMIVMNNKLKAERAALKFDQEQESTAHDVR